MKKRTLEDQVAALYQLMGYEVESTATDNKRYYDLTVTRTTPGLGSISLAIECKARTTKPVDGDEVLAFSARIEPLVQAGTITVGAVITNGSFTSEAHAAAKNKRLTLLSLAQLTGEALQFRPYLEAITKTFDESIEAAAYVELHAHGRKWGRRGQSTIHGNVTELLERWIKRVKQRFLFLVGEAGSGKSTTMLKFARDLAKAYHPKKRIPILLNARTVMESQSIEHAILKRMQPAAVPTIVSAELARRLNWRGELAVLIDGLDELAPPKAYELFDMCLEFGSPARCKVAISCRSGFFNSAIRSFEKTSESTSIVELDPLTADQARSLLEKRGKGLSALARGRPQFDDVPRVPLLLSMVAELLESHTVSESISPATWFEMYVSAIFQRERQKGFYDAVSIAEDLDVLSALAMQIISRGAVSFREEEIPPGRGAAFERLRQLPFIGVTDGAYRFSHKSFLEFFAARFIAHRLQEHNSSALGTVLLSREIVEFVAGFDVPLKVLEGWLTEPPTTIPNSALFVENVQALCLAMRKVQTGLVPRLRVRELRLSKIKCFEEAIFRFHDRDGLSLILGDNAMGKSTALQAVALCALGPEIASSLVLLPDRWLRNRANAGYLQATFDISGLEGQPASTVVIGLEISRGNRQIKLATTGEHASLNADILLTSRSKVGSPGLLVAGYGASRNFRSRDDSRYGSPRDLLVDGIESLFNGSKYPFEPRSVARLVIGDGTPFRDLGAPPTLNPAIRDSVSETLASLLPNPKEGGFTPSGTYAGWYGTAEIEELSDGYRSTLAWAGHLIVQLLAAGNWTKGIHEIPGLVLIDEVDLHLHPQWQRVVVEKIRAAFPNLQFVASTHSPLVAAGACAEAGCVQLLKREGDRAIVQHEVPSVRGWRADQILASELFGYIIDRDPETERALREASILAGKGDGRSANEESRYREVLKTLEGALIPSGQTEAERDIQLRRRRVLASRARDLERELFGEES